MYKKFDIIKVNLNPTKWHEQSWIRPCIILSNNFIWKYLDIYLIAPITSNLADVPTWLIIDNFKKYWLQNISKIIFHQIRVIDNSRIEWIIWTIEDSDLQNEIEEKIKLVFDIK